MHQRGVSPGRAAARSPQHSCRPALPAKRRWPLRCEHVEKLSETEENDDPEQNSSLCSGQMARASNRNRALHRRRPPRPTRLLQPQRHVPSALQADPRSRPVDMPAVGTNGEIGRVHHVSHRRRGRYPWFCRKRRSGDVSAREDAGDEIENIGRAEVTVPVLSHQAALDDVDLLLGSLIQNVRNEARQLDRVLLILE